MDVRLSPEQAALRSTAARLVADLGPSAVGALDDGQRTARLESALIDTGWRELRSAMTDAGAPWASGVEAALVAEELAKGAADVAYLGPTLAAELRRLAGAPAASERETVAFVADLAAIAHDAGASSAIAVDAAGATAALLLQPASGGWSLVSTRLADVSVGVDLTRPIAHLAGDVTPVVGQQRMLSDDDLQRVTVLGLALSVADLVGAMDGATRLAIDYVAQRQQYGRAVGSFQAVQHLLADAFTITEGSRSAGLHAAWAVDALPVADALHAASVAKAYAARSARTACETSIQVHGGIGNTWECMAHVYLRRVLQSIDLFGGVGTSLDRVLAHHGIGGD